MMSVMPITFFSSLLLSTALIPGDENFHMYIQQHRETTPQPTELLNIAGLLMFLAAVFSYLV